MNKLYRFYYRGYFFEYQADSVEEAREMFRADTSAQADREGCLVAVQGA